MEKSDYRGWHSVATGFVHRGDVEIRGFLEYYQKEKFKEGEPLYPLLLLYFNRSVEYKVIWRYEGIATNYFEVIDNGTGYIRAPFKEGHERHIIYNGTVHGTLEFEEGQDIVKAWKNDELLFGLNWEREKFRFKKLIICGEDDVSMEVVEERGRLLRSGDGEYMVVGYTPPAPDQGGGGSSEDSDGDGLTDSQEEAGWYIWVCTSDDNWHHVRVYSDPHNPDTDGDYVSDETEYDHGTNPQEGDTDNDALSDRQEIYYYGTCAYNWDSDEDRMSDKEEVDIYHTDPLVRNDRYAVLIARYTSYDASSGYDEFWNDLKIMYDILIDRGYIDDGSVGFDASTDHIAVLYGDGHDMKEGKYGTPSWVTITDYSATKTNLKKVFTSLGNVMDENDILTVWTFDHGAWDSRSHAYLCVQDGEIRDDDFAVNYVGKVHHYYRRYIIMAQCHSGGFIDDLHNSKTIIMTSCKLQEDAYRCDDRDTSGHWKNENEGGNYHHSEFLFYMESALRGRDPLGESVNADSDGNGYISLVEAFNYAYTHDSWRVLNGFEHPQWSDDGNIGGCAYL